MPLKNRQNAGTMLPIAGQDKSEDLRNNWPDQWVAAYFGVGIAHGSHSRQRLWDAASCCLSSRYHKRRRDSLKRPLCNRYAKYS